MTEIAWTDEMSVGVDTLDEEHRYLISLINRSYVAIAEQDTKTVLWIFDELLDYVDVHFGHEEEVMKAMAYPGLARHVAEHVALASRATALIEELRAGKVFIKGKEFTDFLKDWLLNHILVLDMDYSRYMVRPVAA